MMKESVTVVREPRRFVVTRRKPKSKRKIEKA